MTPTAASSAGDPSAPATASTLAPNGQPALTGTNWLWIGFTGPNDQVPVETPMSYSLVFQQDGTVNITADCNHAQGFYQADGPSIKIQVGPMTKAMCPPGSHSDAYLQYLGSAAAYSLQDGNLCIDLAADGGTMVFAPSEVVKAEDSGGALRSALQANPWQWASFTSPVEQYDVQSPQNYQLTFHENGTVDIKADCNTANGTYTMQGSRISIVVGAAAMTACPAGSRSEEFLKYLGSAAIYFFQPGELFIDLGADGGTMRFTPFVP
jgi:heat shock protein HslJ